MISWPYDWKPKVYGIFKKETVICNAPILRAGKNAMSPNRMRTRFYHQCHFKVSITNINWMLLDWGKWEQHNGQTCQALLYFPFLTLVVVVILRNGEGIYLYIWLLCIPSLNCTLFYLRSQNTHQKLHIQTASTCDCLYKNHYLHSM